MIIQRKEEALFLFFEEGQGLVGGDTVEPGKEGGVPFKLIQGSVGFDEGVLRQIICILMDEHHAANDLVYGFLIGFDQLPKPHLPGKGGTDTVEECLVVFLHGLGLDLRRYKGFNTTLPNLLKPYQKLRSKDIISPSNKESEKFGLHV